MRAVIQRVKKAKVTIGNVAKGQIDEGLLVFLGIEKGDENSDIDYLVSKTIGLRVFEDENGKMNLDVKKVNGSILIISQFTIVGDVRRGNRPSFFQAEDNEKAKKLYNTFIKRIEGSGIKVEQGEFQADMDVELNNDGPVTILLDSKKLF